MNDKFKNTKVKELSDKDYDISKSIKIKNNKNQGIVVFYYYWCGYCEMVKPELLKLAEKKNISVYAIHGDNAYNKKAFEFLAVQGVPHLRYVTKSGIISKQYTGQRKMEDLLKYIKTSSAQKGGKKIKKSTKKPAKKIQKGGKKKGLKQRGGTQLPKDLEDIVMDYKKQLEDTSISPLYNKIMKYKYIKDFIKDLEGSYDALMDFVDEYEFFSEYTKHSNDYHDLVTRLYYHYFTSYNISDHLTKKELQDLDAIWNWSDLTDLQVAYVSFAYLNDFNVNYMFEEGYLGNAYSLFPDKYIPALKKAFSIVAKSHSQLLKDIKNAKENKKAQHKRLMKDIKSIKKRKTKKTQNGGRKKKPIKKTQNGGKKSNSIIGVIMNLFN